MATISSLGSGSGLDLSSLLTSLMQAEQVPLVALQTKEAGYQSKISALGTLSSVLASLQTAASSMVPTVPATATEKFTSFSASVADTAIASATATKGAVAGSYSLEVSTLAQTQRLVSPITNGSTGYTSATSTIGTGDLTIEFGALNNGTFTADGSRTKTITIDSTNATLGGLRDAINAANIGATATIITGTSGAQLVLSSKETGLSNVMKLSVTNAPGNTTPLTGFDYDPAANTGTLTQAAAQGGQAATNASFSLNGIPATSSTNTISNVLDGVTLTLLKTTAAATPTTVKVTKDSTSSINTALTAFIKAYNAANTSISSMGAYNATTKEAGALQGNATLRSSKNQLTSLFFSTKSAEDADKDSPYQTLSNIGVSLAKDGSLSLDTTKLNAAITADSSAVANLVAAVGKAYKTGIEGMVGTTGTITSATDGIKRSITDVTKQQTALSTRLTAIEARYRKRFTALDTLIAGMKQTSTYLTQQLANLRLVIVLHLAQNDPMFGMSQNPAAAYARVSNEIAAETTDPHRLILMLFEGARTAISKARLHMERNEIPERGAAISKAIDIITNGLMVSLDPQSGGELAERLDALYAYISQRLVWANLKNNVAALDEADHLLGELESAWIIITPTTDSTV